MNDPTNGEQYEAVRLRITDVVRTADPETTIPATPAWNVGDLVRHLAGLATDVATGNTDRYAQDDWTANQIAARADHDIPALLDEWERSAPALEAILDDPESTHLGPWFKRGPIADVASHEADLRVALGLPPVLDVDLVASIASDRIAFLGIQIDRDDLPGLHLVTPEGPTWTPGTAEPRVNVTTDLMSLWRSLTGRRTRDQVRSFLWSSPPEPYLDLWPGPVFAYPDTEIE
jgi:uncharacterized protein (TIGR03083 family)